MRRLILFFRLLGGLKWYDFRAARTWINNMYPGKGFPTRVVLFVGWALETMWKSIPDALQWAQFENPVSRTPVWLREGNPFANHPFSQDPEAKLSQEVEVVVIGAGFVGAAAAYHWSKKGNGSLVLLEMNDPASGSAGRNEGLVVMGRYYHMVHSSVLKYLNRTRRDLSEKERDRLAHEFSAAYAKAAYANAELIQQTIQEEGIQCEYARKGWVQTIDHRHVDQLEASARMAQSSGFKDWIKISKEEAFERGGITTGFDAGFSIGAATWHPAKWVWGLLRIALASPHIELFTRTKVLRITDLGERYVVETDRATVYARYVINATESHTPLLFKDFHNIIQPTQTQAAFGPSDGGTMKEGVGISGKQGFYGHHSEGVLFGSDSTRVRDEEAGKNQPSRFITHFLLSQMRQYFGVRRIGVSNEWSGTVSYTPDEFPLVGLMDDKRLYLVGGMAGSGSAVSFLGARHIVNRILEIGGTDYYPEKYFSPKRFLKNRKSG